MRTTEIVDTSETFQNEDGKPVALTGTAVWTVDDGKLRRGWVEQASFELYHYLLAK